MALGACLAKAGGPLLISQLDQAKGGLKPVDKEHLYILLIDGGVLLVEDFDKEVIRKIIGRPEDMDPGAFLLRVRLEHQAGQRVLEGKILRYLIVQAAFNQLEIQVKIASETIRKAGMLPFSGVVTQRKPGFMISEILLKKLVILALEFLMMLSIKREFILEIKGHFLINLPAPQVSVQSPVDIVVGIILDALESSSFQPEGFRDG